MSPDNDRRVWTVVLVVGASFSCFNVDCALGSNNPCESFPGVVCDLTGTEAMEEERWRIVGQFGVSR